MKSIIIFALLFVGVSINTKAQTLKDLLYKGKLKSDTGSVVRSTDDLKTKIDTSTRKKPEEIARPATVIGTDSVAVNQSAATTNPSDPSNPAVTTTTGEPGAAAAIPTSSADITKSNNAKWKAYMDELSGSVRTEVLPSGKMKKGTYSVLISYEIGVDGQVNIVSVEADPKNSFLEDQIKERLTLSAPQLIPMMYNGKPRKVAKKQLLSFSK